MKVKLIRALIKGLNPEAEVSFEGDSIIIHPTERVLKISAARKVDFEKVWELHKKGLGSTEIARRVNSTKQNVTSIIRTFQKDSNDT